MSGKERVDGRRGPRPRRQALCCACGNLRTIAKTYTHPADRAEHDAMWGDIRARGKLFPTNPDYCVQRAKCDVCGVVTKHAGLRDQDTEERNYDFGEEKNRQVDAVRKMETKWIRRFELEGVVVRRLPHDKMQIDGRLVEVYEIDGRFEIVIDESAPAENVAELLAGKVDSMLDDPAKWSDWGARWHEDERGRWRGISVS